MADDVKTKKFQAHTKKLLDLMIHSVYAEREVFLRELISNASDAIDKVRFLALTDESLAQADDSYQIKLDVDKEARTLTMTDNGVGMSYDEVVKNLGTIAQSGTEEFMDAMDTSGKDGLNTELIGRFGLGFYSSFMVADEVIVETYKRGEEAGVRWSSKGGGTYTIEPMDAGTGGTTITLKLKELEAGDGDDEVQDFTSPHTLRSIVTRHSDFVQWPVVMDMEKTEYPDNEDGTGKDYSQEPKRWMEAETLNSQQALWTRDKNDLSDEDYHAFYKRLTRDWTDPSDHLHMKVEGMMEYTALMYLPERAPTDLYTREARRGLSLYTKNVFIMEDCRELMPEYLRFIRGLVDSPDIPLNVSRETVQQDRVIATMRKTLTKKWLSRFEELTNNDREAWEKIWVEFGSALKEGFHYDPPNKDRLAKIALWRTTHGEGWSTLAEYVERMRVGQDEIFVLMGKSIESLQDSPQLEMFKSKGVEVILLTDAVDEIIVRALDTFEEKKLVDAARGEVNLDEVISEGEDAPDADTAEEAHVEMLPLCERLKTLLDGPIEDVRPSKRLTDSAVCLVTPENGITLQMEQMMRAMGQEVPQSKRLLELNPSHALIQKLSKLHAANAEDERLSEFGEILYAQALLSEGGQLENPARYARQIADVLAKTL